MHILIIASHHNQVIPCAIEGVGIAVLTGDINMVVSVNELELVGIGTPSHRGQARNFSETIFVIFLSLNNMRQCYKV